MEADLGSDDENNDFKVKDIVNFDSLVYLVFPINRIGMTRMKGTMGPN